ncbi:MAG: hypothetical protein K2N38_02880 [Oscillospiraceae bacterium]|nr:hypothetical protein [Oscillospiraceae bacterium]
MFNRKHTTAFTAILMAAALLTGCQENTEPMIGGAVSNENLAPAAAPEVPVSSAPETIIDDEAAPLSAVAPDPSKIIIDCTLPDNYPSQVPLLKAGLQKFEVGVPEKLFLDDAGLVLDKDYYVYDHPEEDHHVYVDKASDLLLMGYGDGHVSNYDRLGNYQYVSIRSAFDCYKMTNFFSDTALEGFTAEDAISRGNELLAQLGITNTGTPKVWAITADKANEYIASQTWENKDGTPQNVNEWTADDEVYFLTYPIAFNSVPVSTQFVNRGYGDGRDGSFTWNSGSYIELTVGKDRIATVQSYQIFSEDAEITGTADITITPQQALDTIIEHYNNSYFREDFDVTPVTVNSCSLVYLVDHNFDTDEYTLRPVWEIGVEWKHNAVNCSETYRHLYEDIQNIGVEFDYVDAVTGEAHFDAF